MGDRLDEMGGGRIVTRYSPGVDTILAPLEPGEAERSPSRSSPSSSASCAMYDHVVIDTPPAFNEHVLAALDASDPYVLLATPDIPALKSLRVTLDMFDLLGYPRDGRLVVLNRADAKVGLAVADVEKTLKTRSARRSRPAAPSLPRSTRAFRW